MTLTQRLGDSSDQDLAEAEACESVLGVVDRVEDGGVGPLGVAAILTENIYFLFLVILLMGSQSALFGPAKLGSIPEMLPSEKISSA